jgi:hypothetical protein
VVSSSQWFQATVITDCLVSGMQFVLYLLCVYVLLTPRTSEVSPKPQNGHGSYKRSGHPSNFTIFLIIYSTILCIVNILYTASTYVGLPLTFISNRNFPGGPVGFINVAAGLPTNVMSITMLVLSSVLSDALLLWRCRLIWRLFVGKMADLVMIFPTLMLLASLSKSLSVFFIQLTSASNSRQHKH